MPLVRWFHGTTEPLLDHATLRAAALTAGSLAEGSASSAAIVRILRTARGNAFCSLPQRCPHDRRLALACGRDGPRSRRLGARRTARATRELERCGTATSPSKRPPARCDRGRSGCRRCGSVRTRRRTSRRSSRPRFALLLGPKVLPDLVARIAPEPGAKKFSPAVRAAFIEASAAVAHAPCPAESLTALVGALRVAVLENDRRVTTSALCALSRLGDERDLELAVRFVGSSSKPIAHAAQPPLPFSLDVIPFQQGDSSTRLPNKRSSTLPTMLAPPSSSSGHLLPCPVRRDNPSPRAT